MVNASTLGFTIPESDSSQTESTPNDEASGLSGLDALAAELEGMMLEDDPIAVHEGYDLPALVGAIAAVGFDGTISIDYKGDGDESLGVIHSKEAIEEALAALKE